MADDGRLTILQVVSHAGTGARRTVGGPERRALSALTRWDYERFRIVITYSPEGRLASAFEEAAEHPDVTVLPIPAPGRRDWRAFGRFSNAIRAHGVDVVHSQGPLGTDWWAALAARWTGAASVVTRPVALTQYQLHPRTFRRFLLLDHIALSGLYSMVFVSEQVRQEAIRCRETTAARSRVILNGVDLARFRPRPRRRDAPPTFGMIGRLLPVKCWDVFLDVCARVFDAVPDSRASIIGDGPEGDRIEAEIEARGWRDRVVMTGFCDDVTDDIADLDVLVLTSSREGLPVSLIEGMATARPVVATDVGGVREIVADDSTGFVRPAGDAEGLAAAVIRLLGDPALRTRMGAAARRDAERRLSLESMVRGYEQVYEEAAMAKRRQRADARKPVEARAGG